MACVIIFKLLEEEGLSSQQKSPAFPKTRANDGYSKVSFSTAISSGTFKNTVNKILTRLFDKHTSPPLSGLPGVCPAVSHRCPGFPSLLLLTDTGARARPAVPATSPKGPPWW